MPWCVLFLVINVSIYFSFLIVQPADAFSRYVDLSHNTQLELIEFTDICSSVASIPIASVLDQITTPTIGNVGIFVDEGGNHTLDGLDWNSIRRILERPNYSGLWSLRISVAGPALLEDTEILMTEKLPKFSERGIITYYM
jgi:hypothetical protein